MYVAFVVVYMLIIINYTWVVSISVVTYNVNNINCVLIICSPFYGYHDREELFLKIYLINPGFIKRYLLCLLSKADHMIHLP